MAKRFAGFKPDTLKNKILPALGYNGPMNQKSINAFLASNPAAAAKMGKYTLAARRTIEGQPVKMAEGGQATQQDEMLKAQQRGFLAANQMAQFNQMGALAQAAYNQAPVQYAQPVVGQPLMDQQIPAQQTQITPAQIGMPLQQIPKGIPQPLQPRSGGQVPPHSHTVSMAKGGIVYAQDGVDVSGDEEDQAEGEATKKESAANTMTKAITSDPTQLVTTPEIVAETGGEETLIDPETGQLGDAEVAGVTTVTGAGDVKGPVKDAAPELETVTSQEEVKAIMGNIEAATGKVGPDALALAAKMDPNELAQLGLTAAQIDQAQKVIAPDARTVQEGELISGSAVDMERVKKETNFEAATGSPSTDATVQGQLTQLMEDFEGGATPPWAAGAMRGAAAMMAARGLSASSMAGQAAIQAAMEAALPIAQADASTFARFEQQNLSNRQQAAMFAAEKRAEFLGLEFTQEFQTRVANAAKISDIANMNFSAEQTIALENARLAQSVDLANLDAANAKILADAAAMTQVDLTNLNNRQQAAVQNANAFLKMDMANLDREQQVTIFKAQELAKSMLSDTAQENATRQFNATSQMQVDQFFASLDKQIQMFNVEQQNAISRFNAGELNAMMQFNTAQINARDQFNAANHLVIAQANAAWSQSVTTASNAAYNQANRDAALFSNNLTMTAYNNLVQRDRDVLAWAWQSGENEAQRDANILIAKIQAEADALAESGSASSAAFGKFLGQLAINAADLIFSPS